MSKKQKKNYFELLGMPSQFDLDLIELERQYLERIRLAHPDQRGDTQASSQLNQAYQALSNLLARAQHLLELRGGEMTETLQDKALLTQSLEGREKLAQAENSETLQALEKGAQTRVKEAQKVLTLSFEKEESELTELARQVCALSYHVKYLSQVEEKIFEEEDRRAIANF